jgi:nicotinamide-nucleotide amidase
MTDTLSPAVPDEVDELAQSILTAACDGELKLATAESCTGGLLASVLTDVTNLSHAFERGFVTYTDEAKHELLGVPEAMLKAHGAVSEPVARAMAEGALANSRADLSVSTTGFAGPAGPDDEPGLVHFAVARRNGPTIHREEHYGSEDRGEVRRLCLMTALDMLNGAVKAG